MSYDKMKFARSDMSVSELRSELMSEWLLEAEMIRYVRRCQENPVKIFILREWSPVRSPSLEVKKAKIIADQMAEDGKWSRQYFERISAPPAVVNRGLRKAPPQVLFDIKAEHMAQTFHGPKNRFTAFHDPKNIYIAMSRLAFAGSGVASQKGYGNTVTC